MSGAGFDSGLLSQGQTFKHTFNKVGVVEYFCSLHPTMVGKVSVSS
jgi:plastocyanin